MIQEVPLTMKLTLVNFAGRAAFVMLPAGAPRITAREACCAVGLNPDEWDAEQASRHGVRLDQVMNLNTQCPRPRVNTIYVR
jgi:hypothetical protein